MLSSSSMPPKHQKLSKITKTPFPPLPISDIEARHIVTYNGFGENQCCKNRTNCFLETLSLEQAALIVKRCAITYIR